MNRVTIIPQIAVAVLLFTGVCLGGQTRVSLSDDHGHPKTKIFVSGRGFGPYEAVDIYFDEKDVLLAVTGKSGKFSAQLLKVPPDSAPGTHWITAIGRHGGIADQAPFRVRTDWLQIGFTPQANSLNPYENVIGADNAKTLNTFWMDSLKAEFDTPAIANGHLYLSDLDGFVVLDANSGREEWHADFGRFGMGTPAISSNGYYLYLGDFSGGFHAVNLDSHNEIWKVTTAEGGFTSPTLVENLNLVIVGTASVISDGILYALDASNGTVRWSYQLASGDLMNQSGAIAVANGLVYVVTYQGNVLALDAATGAVRWTQFVDVAYGSAAVSNGALYVSQGDGKLYAFNAQTGSTLWIANTAGVPCFDPAVGNGAVYLTCTDHKLYAFDTATGSLLWTANAGTGASRRPVIANGIVFVGCHDLKLYAFDARNGSQLWTASAGGYAGAPAVIADGVVYFNTADQMTAYALDGSSRAAYRRHRPPPAYSSLHPDLRLKPHVN